MSLSSSSTVQSEVTGNGSVESEETNIEGRIRGMHHGDCHTVVWAVMKCCHGWSSTTSSTSSESAVGSHHSFWRVVPSSQCVLSSPLSSPTVLAGIVEASGVFVGVDAVTSESDRWPLHWPIYYRVLRYKLMWFLSYFVLRLMTGWSVYFLSICCVFQWQVGAYYKC